MARNSTTPDAQANDRPPLPPFALRLKALREAAGLTQEQLAGRAGLHVGAVFKLEQGRREPAWGTVQALARALGVELTAFADAAAEEAPSRPRARRTKDEAADSWAAGLSAPTSTGLVYKAGMNLEDEAGYDPNRLTDADLDRLILQAAHEYARLWAESAADQRAVDAASAERKRSGGKQPGLKEKAMISAMEMVESRHEVQEDLLEAFIGDLKDRKLARLPEGRERRSKAK